MMEIRNPVEKGPMKNRRLILTLALCILAAIYSFPGLVKGAGIGEGVTEDLSQESMLESSVLPGHLRGNLTPARLRVSSYFDPIVAGRLDMVFKPSIDLMEKRSFSLKVTLPGSWDSGLYAPYEESGSQSAGLFATVRLNVLPTRYGSWSVNTGFFFVRKDSSFADQTAFPVEFDHIGSIGTVNISISY